MKFFTSLVFLFLCWLSSAQPLNVPPFGNLNSSYDELNPVLSPDGRTLYMTIANHPLNRGGKRDPGDIWKAELSANGEWSAPVHVDDPLNHPGFNGVAGFSWDGQQMFLLSHYNGLESPRTQGIAVSQRTSSGWGRPENISIPYFQNKSGVLTGYMDPQQRFFVFSAETYGTRGVEDIYVTIRKGDGRWTEPKNLGSTINTQFQELSPSVSPDGTTLYFSSNGRKGFGSFDVYASTRLDESWTSWSEPVNLGSEINSDGRELYYRDYSGTGFSLFTSTRNSDGYGDIKMFRKDIPSSPPVDTVKTVFFDSVQVVKENKPPDDGRVRVYGKVTNAKTGVAIPAHVVFASATVMAPADATVEEGYELRMDKQAYSIRIESPGFISVLEKLDIGTPANPEQEANFKLQPIEVGTIVNLKNVLFEQGKTILLTESYSELDVVVSFLNANPGVKIELAGHTDNRGIPAQNVKLSQARVDRVKKYLVENGVDKKRITGKGYGSSQPVASNDTEETRQLNRRVEFMIKKL